uniref:Myosin IXAa n=1 Tax=Callorhinchus milii TaxID=7868 RepID=A0A4W3HZ31_CALMI
MNVHDVGGRRRHEDNELTLRIYPGNIAEGTIYCPVTARKNTSAAEVIEILINKLHLDKTKCYVLAEVKEFGGEEWILNPTDCPVQRVMLWPRNALENRFSSEDYRFLLREKNLDGSIHYSNLQSWLKVTEERRRMMERGFLPQPQQKDYDDLCNLPDLNEKTLLDNLRNRFKQEKIYTYVGTILIAINPFKFLPIYNPKYVKMYDNHPLGKLEPHIYAIADVAYHAMLQCRKNQCIVISGESGSGKTQSTNFLIHHLTALSQKGFASGVEQIILGAGPVLEAFGNAKTAHNNNSSRFGKFIQVNYQETGTVRGAYVEKYLLEKSRLVYQEHNERNYHVFYYLLAGASEEEKKSFHLLEPEEYHYLNQMTQSPYRKTWDDYYYDSEPDSFTVEGEDLKHDFERLQLAMEMVGFLPKTRKQIFSLLSAILHLGNIKYKRKTFRDDSIDICNPEVLPIVSELLEVKDEMLFEALTTRKTVTVGDRLILPYKLSEAVTVRDSMAKSLYSALFDWIVFRINHALLNNRNLEEHIKILSIGVLDIFGFEDYENNSFEQFCINFANERLQHYFNQHIFKLEQEEYRAEGISWHNIDYIDNSSCINLISKKPTGLLHLLDEECNFPQATNQTLLDKFKRQNEGNNYIEFPAVMEPAFIIKHYAGKVKYQVKDFREKNTDHMRPDIVALLKSSKNAFICSLIGIDPVAGFRWAVLRSYFRAAVAFREAGKRHDDAVPLPVLKSVDSFSFLHHPVHQRSLEILQRCKEEKYSKFSPSLSLVWFFSELHGMSWNGRTGVQAARLSSSHSLIDDEGIFLSSASSKLLERHLLDVRTLKYIASMTLHDRITKSLLHLHKKKKPPSISAQFQASLNKLMETLGQAEPYFVKCIRSNAEKLPLRFNDHLVLRQLRYTGMLETVRIRQSGYSIKYSFQEFVDHFHVLLLQGTVPSQCSIQEFMREADLNPDNYQVGKTMVRSERQRLQSMLHTEVVRRIVLLQSWFRAVLERKLFLQMKRAAVVIQVRMQNLNETNHTVLNTAATSIQATWKSYQQRKTFVQMRAAATIIQRSWQQYWRRRLAALCLQIAWRRYRDMRAYRALRQIIIRFQAVSRGYLTRQSSVDVLGSTSDFANSSSTVQGVLVRERPKSLSGDPDKQKVVRAKRHSRRMRELEQAIFSLELLKVRSGGVSPSEERRWSTEQTADSANSLSPQGTPDSESSRGSFEVPSCEDSEKRKESVSDEPTFESGLIDAQDILSTSPRQNDHFTAFPFYRPLSLFFECTTRSSGYTAGLRMRSLGFSLIQPAPDSVCWSFVFLLLCYLVNQVARPAHKKKARMARTRSDFLTRAPNAEGEGETEEDEYDERSVELPHSPDQPSPELRPKNSAGLACYSDSEMVNRTWLMWERLFANPYCGMGEMAILEFWSLPSGYDPIQHNLTPPRSPDLGLERGKEFKENKEPSPKVRRRRSVKISNVGLEPIHWQHDALQIITSANDFKSMNEFLQKKITDLETDDCKKDTFVDVVFKKSLKEFRLNIFNSYSTALAMDDGKSIRYKDLYALFEQILEKTLRQERRGWNESPVKVWVNTFKVFLDEFMTEYKTLENSTGKVPKVERKKRRKKESDIVEEYNGHVFKSTQYSIPTYCECCSSLIWMMDRAYVCKCKCILMCHGIYSPSLSLTLLVTPQYDPELSSRQFGVEVSRLTNDERTVPLVAEKLINYIEMHGLYTEGIYRKSGSTNKIKELKQGLDTDISSMNLDEYSIHVIASVFKQWLRDLPNPLMTFELYDECLRAMGLQDRKEILRGVYSIIDQLSRSHLSTLERLIFHLVRIALQEDTNRMSSNALAIVFAPCILRCPDTTDPLQSVQDISKTTACVELIIVEQMNKYRARLKDINSLEFAENKAKNRLSLIRRSIGKGRLRRSNYASPASPVSVRLPSVADVPEETNTEETTDIDMTEQQQAAMQQEERTLTEQIETLQKEKEELTFEMLALEPRASDDETLESEASIGTADSSENLNMDSEGAQSERSERSSVISSVSQQRAEAVSRLRRPLRKQADSVESIDSAVHSSASSSASSVPQGGRRFRFRSKSPSPAVYRSHVNCSPDGEARYSQGGKGLEDFPQFTSRGTFNPEKGKHKLKILKRSVQKPKDSPDGASGMGKKRNSEPEYGAPQQLVVFGKNEFMV